VLDSDLVLDAFIDVEGVFVGDLVTELVLDALIDGPILSSRDVGDVLECALDEIGRAHV
jgi:hypothetical protein